MLNSVFLNECIEAGLDSAIVHAAKIVPLARIPDDQRQVALDMVYDRRRPATDATGLRPAAEAAGPVRRRHHRRHQAERAAELAALPVAERLQRRIIDGERKGLQTT